MSYRGELHDGYKLDYTANINNSEGTHYFVVADTEYDANDSINSNGEIEGTASDLTVNAAALKSILQKQ